MNILNFIKSQRHDSAALAKERLQIIVSHSNTHPAPPEITPEFRQELLELIHKYFQVSSQSEPIQVNVQSDNDISILELNIALS